MKIIALIDTSNYGSSKILVEATKLELEQISGQTVNCIVGTEIKVSAIYNKYTDIQENVKRIHTVQKACQDIIESLKPIQPIVEAQS